MAVDSVQHMFVQSSLDHILLFSISYLSHPPAALAQLLARNNVCCAQVRQLVCPDRLKICSHPRYASLIYCLHTIVSWENAARICPCHRALH